MDFAVFYFRQGGKENEKNDAALYLLLSMACFGKLKRRL
jgi:hypothetical protein